jgi:hypothetical protein
MQRRQLALADRFGLLGRVLLAVEGVRARPAPRATLSNRVFRQGVCWYDACLPSDRRRDVQVNGTLSGPAPAVHAFIAAMSAHTLFGGVDWKTSTHPTGDMLPFPDLVFKEVKSIINLGGGDGGACEVCRIERDKCQNRARVTRHGRSTWRSPASISLPRSFMPPSEPARRASGRWSSSTSGTASSTPSATSRGRSSRR